jgi:magnesium transporter
MNRNDLKLTLSALRVSLDGNEFTRIVRHTPPADIADELEAMDVADVARLLQTLQATDRTDLFSHLPEYLQDALLPILPRSVVVQLFETLPSDDRADLFNRLTDEAKAQLLPALAQVEREDILRLAAFPEGSAGSVVTSDYVAVTQHMTARAALEQIRSTAPDKETIYVIYVINSERQLLGTVSLRDLVLSQPDTSISDLMRTDPVFAQAEWPRTQAAELIRRYDLLALPVINGGNRMIGIVTVDDAMDIEKEQDATQLARFGGTAVMGGPDLDIRESTLGQMYKTRIFWLAILTFFGVITSTYVAGQEEILTEVIVLAAFIAPIIDMGGNTGSQSATLVIRAMAIGDIRLKWRDIAFVIKREIPIAVGLGISIAVLEAVLAYFSKGVGYEVLMVVGLTMLIVTILGGVIGALLPFAARRIGSDPATLSAPMITSIMDLLGVFIYFYIAYLFLGHLMV